MINNLTQDKMVQRVCFGRLIPYIKEWRKKLRNAQVMQGFNIGPISDGRNDEQQLYIQVQVLRCKIRL